MTVNLGAVIDGSVTHSRLDGAKAPRLHQSMGRERLWTVSGGIPACDQRPDKGDCCGASPRYHPLHRLGGEVAPICELGRWPVQGPSTERAGAAPRGKGVVGTTLRGVLGVNYPKVVLVDSPAVEAKGMRLYRSQIITPDADAAYPRVRDNESAFPHRMSGSLEFLGWWLDPAYDWVIAKDNMESLVLLQLKKGTL